MREAALILEASAAPLLVVVAEVRRAACAVMPTRSSLTMFGDSVDRSASECSGRVESNRP